MKVRHPRGRAVVLALCTWLACAAAGAGCAHLPPWRRAAPTAPQANAPADTSAVSAPSPTVLVPVTPAADKPVRRRLPEKPMEPASGDSLPRPAEPAPDVLSTEPVISVDLPPAEKALLTDTTQRELELTAAVVRSIEVGRPSPAEDVSLRTIQAYVQASLDATKRAEIREAAALAHKAWILAEELSKR